MRDCARRLCRRALRPAAEALICLFAAAGVVSWTEAGNAQPPAVGSSNQLPAQSAPVPVPLPLAPPTPATNPGLAGPALPAPAFTPPSSFPAPSFAPAPRIQFQFKIDPKTPVKDLLPKAPKSKLPADPLQSDDLARVPEVSFQQAPPKSLPTNEALKQNAHTIAKINHLNRTKHDAFMQALLGERADLSGLPITMGDACRMNAERSHEFGPAVKQVRAALKGGANNPQSLSAREAAALAEGFWERYEASCATEDRVSVNRSKKHREHVTLARIAALMQMLAPETPALRKGLVKYLATISHPEATRALAKMAIFSPEEEIRSAAIDALKVRRERDYTDILMCGLRYPYPAVARRSADALARLERGDLIAKLVDMLEAPDPRLPVVKTVHEKRVPVVREMVRINHHRNCLLCHSPGNTAGISPDVVTAAMPTPGEPLNPPSTGYNQSATPDVLVRVDVTYLRQDFSAMMPVADAHPWPDMQRFDFVVRTRTLTDEEAEAYREKLTPHEAGRLSPYHRAILAALRELTGRDTAPTAQAWRELLALPRKEQ